MTGTFCASYWLLSWITRVIRKRKKRPPKAVTMANNFVIRSINQIKSLDITTNILRFYHYRHSLYFLKTNFFELLICHCIWYSAYIHMWCLETEVYFFSFYFFLFTEFIGVTLIENFRWLLTMWRNEKL